MHYFRGCLFVFAFLSAVILIPGSASGDIFRIVGYDEINTSSSAQYTVEGASGNVLWSATGNFGTGGGISQSGLLTTGSNACGAVMVTAYASGTTVTKNVRVNGGGWWKLLVNPGCNVEACGSYGCWTEIKTGKFRYVLNWSKMFFSWCDSEECGNAEPSCGRREGPCGLNINDFDTTPCSNYPDCGAGIQYYKNFDQWYYNTLYNGYFNGYTDKYYPVVASLEKYEWQCSTCTGNTNIDDDQCNGQACNAIGSCDNAVDCNDNDDSINPGAAEVCGDGKDNDCDGDVDEGCDTSPPGGACPVGNPVDSFCGTDIYGNADIGYPAPSMARIVRSYDSGNPTVGPFGRGTSSNFDRHLLYTADDSLIYTTPGGGSYAFTNSSGTYTNSTYPFLKHAKAYLSPDRKLEFAGGPTYIFSATGALTTVEDINDNWVEISHDPSTGLINGLSDSFGRSLAFTNTTATVDSVEYDLIATITDAMDNAVTYIYNTTDATLTSVTLPDGGTMSYLYNASGIYSTTNPMGVTEVISIYNGSGRVVSQELANGGTFDFSYITNSTTGIMEETQVTNPRDNTTTYKFNDWGYVTETIDALNNSTLFERDLTTNALISTTDPLGRTTYYTYENGYPETVTDPAGNVTSFVYNATYGKPTEITDALDHTTTFTYDTKGNLTGISPPSPYGSITITNTPEGLISSVSDALDNTTSFDYYPTGMIANVIDASENTVAHYVYNNIGQLTSATSPKDSGKTTSYTYDAMGRVQSITTPIGQTAFTNDLDGNITEVEDAKTHTIGFSYNDRGLVSATTDQVGESETYGYDLNDNLTSVTDRKGQAFSFTYDLMDRMTQADYPGSGNYTTYDYDAASRITDIEDYENSSSIGYAWTNSTGGDAFEDRVKTVTTDSGGIANTVTYDYDEIGRRTSMTVEGQPTVYYTYDTGGFLNSVSMGEQTFTLTRDVVGRRTGISYPNGVDTAYTYFPTGTIETIQISNSTSTLESISYTYDEIYNRTQMTRADMPVLLPSAVTSATYNAANRLTSFNSAAVLHDDNGNITSWGSTSYTWNARNQLIAISGTSLTASFKYDAVGRRVEKTINGTTTKYLYDGADIIMEMNGSGTPTVFYVRTLNIDEPLARIDLSSGEIRYYHADALGSIIALTDENSTVKTQYNYSPFGATEMIGEASDNPFQYTGRENDGATGLYYYRNRYQSPILGRFISEDPIGLAGGINFYSYVGNSPLNYTDPSGESAVGWLVCTVATNTFNWALAGYSIYELDKNITQIDEMIKGKECEIEEANDLLRQAALMENIKELQILKMKVLAEKAAVESTGVWTSAATTGACLVILAIPSP